MKPLFENVNNDDNDDDNDEMLMLDKVLAVHEHFDKDQDGFLNYFELRSLQICTSAGKNADILNDMTQQQYEGICQALDCNPKQGVDVESLRLTYATGMSDVDRDFAIVLKLKVKEEEKKKREQKQKSNSNENEHVSDIIDVVPGQDIDISS